MSKQPDPESSNQQKLRIPPRLSQLMIAGAGGIVAITFLAVPILFLLYGAAAAIGGLAVIGGFCVLQSPIFLLLMRIGLLPAKRREEKED